MGWHPMKMPGSKFDRCFRLKRDQAILTGITFPEFQDRCLKATVRPSFWLHSWRPIPRQRIPNSRPLDLKTDRDEHGIVLDPGKAIRAGLGRAHLNACP